MIRQATAEDTEVIIEMLEHYKQASPLEIHKNTSQETARLILDMIFTQSRGVVLLADNQGKIEGMLIAIKNVNMWDKSAFCMNELAYWVEPEARYGSSGYKLLKTYTDFCEIMKSQGEIAYYTISKMVTSPDLKYERFGFKKLEETWSN